MKRTLVILATAVLLGTTACSATPDLDLADSKSPAQLLRIEAVGRLPADLVASAEDIADASIPCGDPDEDPDGTYRAWQSFAEVTLTDDAEDPALVVDALVETFLEQGWSDRSLGGAGVRHSRFIWSDGSLALLRVTGDQLGIDALAVTDEGSTGSVIVIETTGPCVLTGGPDSDEVRMLERRG